MGVPFFNCLKKLHTVFHSGAAPVCIPTRIMVPFSPHPCQHLSFVDLIVAILTGVRQYLIDILIFISLMISDFEHFLLYLLAICISFLEKCLFRSFAHFFNWIVCLHFVKLYEFFIYLYIYIHLIRCIIGKYVLPHSGIPFQFVDDFFSFFVTI
uniref:Uncharacterized protein n=1 Tax=Myotis myotis TaxID=51298 RepID=A0A7J8AN59_MYOMY|nr:hypothetical protein mMyoMyo1_008022 [Myotis myotis]